MSCRGHLHAVLGFLWCICLWVIHPLVSNLSKLTGSPSWPLVELWLHSVVSSQTGMRRLLFTSCSQHNVLLRRKTWGTNTECWNCSVATGLVGSSFNSAAIRLRSDGHVCRAGNDNSGLPHVNSASHLYLDTIQFKAKWLAHANNIECYSKQQSTTI